MNLRLRLSLLSFLALALGLLLVPAAGAGFSPSFYASPAQQSASSGDVSVSPQGTAFFVWDRFYQPTGDKLVELRTRTSAGTFGAPQILTTTGHDAVGPQVATWSGGCVAVWQLQ